MLLSIISLFKNLTILLNCVILQRYQLNIELLLSPVDQGVVLTYLVDEDPNPFTKVVLIHSKYIKESTVKRLSKGKFANKVQNLKYKYWTGHN